MNISFKVALKYGLFIAISLIAYFLILKLFDLHEKIWLRLLNGVVMSIGIYYAIKIYKRISKNEFSYINGIKTGLICGFIATIVFTAFMAIYIFHIDVEFTETILRDWFNDLGVGANILLFTVFIEGVSSTIILSLAFMQLFKKSYNIHQKV
ncbi:DUF4199 domain-containing protein [Flavobacteriales bacterium 33_180_T64]|nr:DUF4199 domain-containing protein [Flavobacteriales bacterium 33_180_T64]